MFLVTSADDFVGPGEEHSAEEVGVSLEAGLKGELFVDLVLLFGLLLLHDKYLSNINYQFIYQNI